MELGASKKHIQFCVFKLNMFSPMVPVYSAKAEEKQKLLKRSLELKTERMQLEEKKQHLSEIIAVSHFTSQQGFSLCRYLTQSRRLEANSRSSTMLERMQSLA